VSTTTKKDRLSSKALIYLQRLSDALSGAHFVRMDDVRRPIPQCFSIPLRNEAPDKLTGEPGVDSKVATVVSVAQVYVLLLHRLIELVSGIR
jgi:hypothetical protein